MRPDGRPFDTALEEAGFSVSAAGENIAYDYKGTAESVVSLWMNSQYHRENILSKEFNYIGVGVCKDGWTDIIGHKNFCNWALSVDIFQKTLPSLLHQN